MRSSYAFLTDQWLTPFTEKVEALDQAQGISECVIIGDTLGYQGLNARSAKETLQQRTSVLEEYQAAVKTTISKRRNIERLKASRNIGAEKVDEALEELEEVSYQMRLVRWWCSTLCRRSDTSRYLLVARKVYHKTFTGHWQDTRSLWPKI